MQWSLDKNRPLTPQICEQVCLQIALGQLQPNERLYSVREAAIEAGVNPNTVQRAFELLEGQNILYSVRGSGWYVSEDISAATDTLKALWREKTAAYFATMQALGMTTQAIKNFVEEWTE
ncbi:MAG: GntR family transcriptional regulator [Clostridia bacterium]|nr:GntR family transcriptional regulator [Clostridia bacterium]